MCGLTFLHLVQPHCYPFPVQAVSFSATVFRVLIASPGDLSQERQTIEEVVHGWNASHAADEGMVLLPVRWEIQAVPEYGDHPQAIINRRLVGECDMLIGAFWSRVGTPTGVAESGTVEEIEQFARARKPVLLYFSSKQIDLDRIDADQLVRVRELRARLEKVALVGQFASIEQLESRLTRDLIVQMRRLRPGSAEAAAIRPSAARPEAPLPSNDAPGPVGNKERLDAQALDTLYLNYWTRFSDVVARSGLGLRPPTPSTRNYARLSLRSSDMRINAFASVRDRLIGVELVLKHPACDDAISRLRVARGEIEETLGKKLEWNEHPGSMRIVFAESGYDLLDRTDWARQHEWLIDKLKAYQQVLLKRIDGMDAQMGAGL